MSVRFSWRQAKVMVQRALFVLGLLVAGMTATCVRLSVEGKRAMRQSDLDFDRGQLRESLLHARRAASLYFPGLQHVSQADARLDAIAIGAESTHRRDLAILAWQAIRTTEWQRHWAHRPASKRVQQANLRLASLLSNDVGGDLAPERLAQSRRTSAIWQAQPDGLSPLSSFVRLLALAAIIGGVYVIHTGIGRRGGSTGHWIAAGAMLSAVGAIAWAICLSLT
ncbi:MAG TPA: hypothetical protein VIV60_25420 [Polyangiaceae bacterium]